MMAQYFEVLSQSDGSLDQANQFFNNGNQENEPTQVRYILAEDSPQFQTQQLLLSANQVVVLDSSQQQIQRVVIDQGHTYQTTTNQGQFSTLVQNTSVNNQSTQHIFYMETNNSQAAGERVQAVIEQASIQTSQSSLLPQPIVLNRHMVSGGQQATTRQVVQGSPAQRPTLQIRAPARQGHVQVNQQSRPLSSPMRQGLPQQVRTPPIPMRAMLPPQIQMRPRITVPQIRKPAQQQLQQPGSRPPASTELQQAKNRLSELQLQKQPQPQVQQTPQAIQQQPQQVVQQPQQPQQVQQQRTGEHGGYLNLIHEGIRELQEQMKSVQEQDNNRLQSVSIGKQIVKPLSEFRPFHAKDNNVFELDDHDPAMNSSPGQIVNYKKLLEQRQQVGKNPILARLPSNIKVTATPASHQQQTQSPACSINQTIDQVVHQVSLQKPPPVTVPQQPEASSMNAPNPSKGPYQPASKAWSKAKSPIAIPRPPTAPPRVRVQRMPVPQQPFDSPRPQRSLPIPRTKALQQQAMQRARLNPPPTVPHPPQQQTAPVQQNGSPINNGQSQINNSQSQMNNSQSQMNSSQPPQVNASQSQRNYLITPPTADRPRQQHPLPAYIPSSQIQQIIGMCQENTPVNEEFADSIRMLVLLENGEQRLITFTLPKEACTIQEILEQVNVPFTPETNIQVTEANTNGINYIVTVGNVSNFGYNTNEEEQQQQQQQHEPGEVVDLLAIRQMQQNTGRPPFDPKPSHLGQASQGLPPAQVEPPKPASPELPKLVPGKLAVCSYCGYTGEDFNKCSRCTRKLPDNVKSVDAPLKLADIFKPTASEITKQLPSSGNSASLPVSSSMKPNAASSNLPPKPEPAAKPSSPTKKKAARSKPVEHEAVVISSDEEEDEKKPAKSVSEQLLNKLGASISISPVSKEPSLTEIKKHVRKLTAEPAKSVKIPLKCRTVRIGSYRFVPADHVILESKCLAIKAPLPNDKSNFRTIKIYQGDIVKVLVCYNKALPVIFYYLNPGAAGIVREILDMTKENKEEGLYFDPVHEEDNSYRRIILLPDDILDELRSCIQQLYGEAPHNIMDELTVKEANNILIKACPRDATSPVGSFSEIKQILMYPKEGQGRLSINTEDYVCLAVDQFLNDKIIDFYLKYLWENLPQGKQEKVHIFSTFFYKRLTTKTSKKSHHSESDTILTAAEKRHSRVKNWTKRINIFEKDFIVVPINENAHWFLAIICFPWMKGAQTFDGKPYNPEPKPKKAKPKQKPEEKKEKPIPCDDPLLSDKDEAESEDSDMESDDSEETAAAAAAAVAAAAAPPPAAPARGRNAPRVPIKQPCILIFDSLAGPSRSRVVATLRDYLTAEFKVKMESERVFNRDVIKGSTCKVPQQNNFTDCGLYLLQYVEQFFKEPITDYNVPIKGILNWFEEIVVTKKREDICNLLKELMIESGTDIKVLPDIALPTANGKLIERPEPERDHETGEEEQEDMFTDIEDSEMTDESSLNTSRVSEENGAAKGEDSSPERCQTSPIKLSSSSIGETSDIVTTVVEPTVLKPTLSEFPRLVSNKDTLNYLKAKRINRHLKAPSDGPEFKRAKTDK